MEGSRWDGHQGVGTFGRDVKLASFAGVVALLIVPTAGTRTLAAEHPEVTERRSGYTYLSEETRKLQDDDFANPGLLWVQVGEKLWHEPAGSSNLSCMSCHGNASVSMRTVATRFPAYSSAAGRVINLEQQINRCRVGRLKAAPLPYESEGLLGLAAYVAHQAKGLASNVSIDGPAAKSFARGKAFFYRRRGQLDLSCANCHEQHAGGHLSAEVISQGQINGFPIYRELWQTMGSTQRMFRWCNEAVRAEPYAFGSQEYVDLELFERWRGRGLQIETPAVRR
jgi:sulfur-oxidizing protein SoxA